MKKHFQKFSFILVIVFSLIIATVAYFVTLFTAQFRYNGKYGVLKLLEDKYQEKFVVVEKKDEGYWVSPEDDKSIKFLAKGKNHSSVNDNYKASVWYYQGSEILEEYGVKCNITKEDLESLSYSDESNDMYDGVSTYSSSENEFCFIIDVEDSINDKSCQIYELYCKLGELEPFCNLEKIEDEVCSGVGSPSYYIPVKVVNGDHFEQTRFSINKEYSQEEIYKKLLETHEKCVKNSKAGE